MRRESQLASKQRARALSTLLLVTLLMIAAFSLRATAFVQPSVSAAQQEAMSASLEGFVERDGKEVSIEGLSVQPGDVITWKMAATNTSDHATTGLHLRGHVPSGTKFVPESASGDRATLLYSADRGNTFSPRPVVRVMEGGVARDVPAAPESYSDVLFVFDGQVAPGEVRHATYQTRVN